MNGRSGSEYYQPTPDSELVAAYTERAYRMGETARLLFAHNQGQYEKKTIIIENGKYSILLLYSHTPGMASYRIGCLVTAAPSDYGIAYPLPIIKPETFDCALELGFQASDINPDQPYVVDYDFRQAAHSSFLSVPGNGTEQMPFDSTVDDWPIRQLRVQYSREPGNMSSAIQSNRHSSEAAPVTALGVSVVAHVVTGLEAVMEKIR